MPSGLSAQLAGFVYRAHAACADLLCDLVVTHRLADHGEDLAACLSAPLIEIHVRS